MPMRPEEYYSSPTSQDYIRYLRPVTPPVDPNRITTRLVRDRKDVGVPTNGDWSLVMGYSRRPDSTAITGYVASAAEVGGDLSILQLQGAPNKAGYRLASGLEVVVFVAHQIESIATHPDAPYERVTMPPVVQIEGADSIRSERAFSRYNQLAAALDLSLSVVEGKYVRDLK